MADEEFLVKPRMKALMERFQGAAGTENFYLVQAAKNWFSWRMTANKIYYFDTLYFLKLLESVV